MKNTLVNGLLLVFSLVLSLEVAGYLSYYWMPNLYNHSAKTLSMLESEGFDAKYNGFLNFSYSPTLGWGDIKSLNYKERDCLGESHPYTIDAQGVRTFDGYDTKRVQVLLTGDSFTFGHEVANNSAIAARVYQQTGIVSANVAYKGFDPLQALMRVQMKRHYFPHAKVVVLGIMYEDIIRLVSTYSSLSTNNHYINLKPYMRNGKIIPMDPKAFSSIPDLIRAAREAFANDYWAKPEYKFPYSVALLKALTNNHFWNNRVSGFMRRLGRQYEYQFRDKELGEDLFTVVNDFAVWAKDEHLVPVVFFLPQNYHDTTSPNYWLADYKERLPDNVIFKNLDFSGIDKKKYTWKSNGDCHPSDYGVNEIAIQYAAVIKEALKKAEGR